MDSVTQDLTDTVWQELLSAVDRRMCGLNVIQLYTFLRGPPMTDA